MMANKLVKMGMLEEKTKGEEKPKLDTSQVTSYNYGKKYHLANGCTKPKVSLQSMCTFIVKDILHRHFIAKASRIKLNPSLLFFKRVSW